MCVKVDAYVHAHRSSELFSFYKEEKAGEEHNYIHHYARAHGKTVQASLRDMLDESVGLMYRVRNMLSGKERYAWDEFVAGYTQFHLHTPRYRIHEILPEFF